MSFDYIREDDAVQGAAKTLLFGCAPERGDDLAHLWQDYCPKFQLTQDIHDGRRVIMEAGAYRLVRYNHRVLRGFWIAGYVAWEGYNTAHRTLTLNVPLDLTRLASLLSAFESVISSDRPG